MKPLDLAFLKEVLSYDAETGIFTWKSYRSRQARAGGNAGTVNAKNGYAYIGVERKRYLAHRLAWFYTHGKWPIDDIDHIDGVRTNNRIGNLREATRAQNLANTPGRKVTPKGVHFMKNRGTWNAKLANKHIGAYRTMEEAAEAYRTAATEAYGKFARF